MKSPQYITVEPMPPAPQLSATDERMSRLAETFPTLRGRPGVWPFDAKALDAFGVSAAATSGSKEAVRFVLSVWSGGASRSTNPAWYSGAPVQFCAWQVGPFDVVRAFLAWDGPHRDACIDWLVEPFWP